MLCPKLTTVPLTVAILSATISLAARATVNARGYGAQGDGRSNDTVALNRAFSAGCATQDDVYLPAGIYNVGSLETFTNCGLHLHGDGPTRTILRLCDAPHQSGLTFSSTSAKTPPLFIEELSLDGRHLSAAGISIEGYESVRLNKVFVRDFGTPGYGLGHKKPFDGIYIRNVENLQVTESQFTGNERSGIELQAVHNSIVRDSNMSLNGRLGGVSEQNFEGPLDGPIVAQWLDNILIGNGSGGIDVETDPRLTPAQGILEGNHVIDCGNDRWDAGWALVLGVHSFGSIKNNSVQRFAVRSSSPSYADAIVYGQIAGPVAIIANIITGTRSRAILGVGAAYPVQIAGNKLTGNGAGIAIYNTPRVRIAKNTISHSLGIAIAVFGSPGSTIRGNQFAENIRDLAINGQDARQERG